MAEKEPRVEDERLLVEAAQRDPRCFGALYELHFHRVYAYAVKRLPNREEAEDVTSVVFHQALAKIKSYEWRGVPFSAWLIRIAANAIADRWQRTAHEGDLPDGVKDDVPDVNAEDAEQRAVLVQLVEGLPAEQRRVVVLRFVEQKSIREIAREVRKTEGAVKQLQFRALQNCGRRWRVPMPKRPDIKNAEQLNSAIDAMLASRASAARAGEDARRSIARAEAHPLMSIAQALCEIPREDFRERLKADLELEADLAKTASPETDLDEGSISMTIAPVSPAAARVFAAPRMTFKDVAQAMEFYSHAFGAKETFRFQLGSGIPHAEMTIGDSVIFFTEEWPDGNRYSAETLGNSPVLMSIQVPDVDAFVERAIAAELRWCWRQPISSTDIATRPYRTPSATSGACGRSSKKCP